jgi:hypothetical protein
MSRINSVTSSSVNAVTTDIDIFPVNNSILSSQYVYDGQTILLINSTLNPNSNIVKAQYFNPVSGSPGSSGPLGFAEWNFDLVPQNYLNGVMTSSSLLSENTSIYSNLQSFSQYNQYSDTNLISLGQYELDIVNGGRQTSGGTSYNTEFFSLTSQPYVTSGGEYVNSDPTYSNVNPGYSSNNSDNFIFTSNYYTQQKNEIIIVQLVFTVTNTSSLNVLGTVTSNIPSVSVIVYNKVITQDNLASLASNNNSKTKIYTAGPIPLQYVQSGTAFNPNNGSYSINNNVPIIIAEGYTTLYATLPVIYVPPIQVTNEYTDVSTWTGQYLNNGLSTDSDDNNNPGYYISSNVPSVPINGTNLNVTPLDTSSSQSSSPQVLYGHFVIGVAYSTDTSSYNPGSFIQSNVLIKNIWRSPISIYNSYYAFSVNDMATKLVVLLFGASLNGGTFLVTNTGTSLNLIKNYGVTSLRNFMNIMTAVITTFDGSTPLVDYFISKQVGQAFNYQEVTLQPLLDGNIINPDSVALCPNMYYFFLNSVNSANMSIDPSTQKVFGQGITPPYFGLNSSILCSTGLGRYYNSSLTMLSTNERNDITTAVNYLFGNSVYLGLNTIGNQSFYILLILPEALFNGKPTSTDPNTISIFSTASSLFYLSASGNTSSQFSPTGYRISNTGVSTINKVSTTITPSYNINKIVLSVSNLPLQLS